MDSTFFGKDGFIWWKGVVENRKDPLFLGRVKVRIFGWHTDDVLEMPTENLPWATPSLPIDNGRNPVGLKEGDWCWGFFLDGAEAQKPVVVGFMPGIDTEPSNPERGYGDMTPDSELEAGKVPRPPEMVPPAEPGEEDENAPKTPGGRFYNTDRLPGTNIAFGVLADQYDPQKYKYDVNKDGAYNQEDAETIIDSSKGKFFTGSVSTTQAAAPISRYPLETRLNEPFTSRLARNEKIESSVLGTKLADLSSGEVAGFEGTSMGEDQSEEPSGFIEPQSPYAAVYPYNHVYESESGHVVEIDDSPGAERLHWYHRSGTFREIHPDGTQVNKVKNTEYNFIYKDFFNYTEGSVNFHANEAFRVKAGAAATVNATAAINLQAGANLNALAKSNINARAKSNLNVAVGDDCLVYVEGGKLHIKVAKDVVIQADGAIQLQSPESVSLMSPVINLQGEGGGEATINLVSSDIRANWLTAHRATTAMPGPPGKPDPATPAGALDNDADKDVKKTPEDSSQKEGFLLPYGTPGDVWKPESDSDGKLVTLSATAGAHVLREAIPTGELESVVIKYQHPDQSVTEWTVVRPVHVPGEIIATGEYKGMFEDGVRHMYRWPKSGKAYPKQCFWINEGGTESLILDGSVRHQCFPPAPFNDKVPMNLRKPNN